MYHRVVLAPYGIYYTPLCKNVLEKHKKFKYYITGVIGRAPLATNVWGL
jgi:hypothetical protein